MLRFVVFDAFQVGILDEDGIHDVTPVVAEPWRGTRRVMNHVVERFEDLRAEIERCARQAPPIAPDRVRLRPPVPLPTQLLAAPSNNRGHHAEMRAFGGTGAAGRTPRDVGFFLKAPGSIVGPSDAIELPNLPDRRFDHEAELAVVIGREARGVAASQALDHVFGYTALLDITLRTSGERREERPMRKSYASFTPVGPTLVTSDEVADPGNLGIRLWRNDELRQDANTRDLIVSVPELIGLASQVLPLQPGDLYTTGTPAGVGPIQPGDRVTVEIDRVGRMTLPVRLRAW